MIALDTNVLARFLVEDDEEQTERARRLIAEASEAGQRLFVSDIALCELTWVLRRSYRLPKPQIIHTLRLLLRSRQIEVGSADRIRLAVSRFEAGSGDFADYVIQQLADEAGAEAVVTFDRALLAERGFQQP